ncbi:Protein CBG25907 [Caenorhabditis briggsae]|uniref:Uncharacterized protein n=2 Tax=Caenorhabditis briggsae TaxID=6238 RepID=A0AAE9DDG9_CAEBR|nr:Protein CBG25907 [Caenorhabditis briggsae]ULU01955.1 hypothetical protein L3Y34_001915 [Caenorhabditis briggsae]CAR99418.1 Protein CBG25907 [Caenorhabditis briggsae]
MAHFYEPRDSRLSKAPLCCCCIPIKFIVLLVQVLALVFQIWLLCAEKTSNVMLFVKVLLAVYTAFTFGVFLIEHKSLMNFHCFLGVICLLAPFAHVALEYFASAKKLFLHYDYSPKTDVFVIVGIIMLVVLVYLTMCRALVNELNKQNQLPSYVAATQPSFNTEYMPELTEKTKLIHPIYPQLQY